MKFTPSAFQSDHLQLSRWELLKLFFGRVLRDGALVIECRPQVEWRPPAYSDGVLPPGSFEVRGGDLDCHFTDRRPPS